MEHFDKYIIGGGIGGGRGGTTFCMLPVYLQAHSQRGAYLK